MRSPIRLSRLKPLLLIIPVAIGGLALATMIKGKEPPARAEREESARAVRIIEAVKTDAIPRVVGYGVSSAGRTWRAVAQVPGRIVVKNEKVAKGAIIPAKTMLLQIDPREYQHTVDQMHASLRGVEARITELATRETNAKRVLGTEKRSLELLREELASQRRLLAKGSSSQTEVDREERNYLQQLSRVSDLENTLNLVPSELQRLTADKAGANARWEAAKLALAHTTIRAPFDCRVVSDAIEQTQFVTAGQILIEADGIAVAEVTAQVPISRFRRVLPQTASPVLFADIIAGSLLESLGLSATVRMRAGDFEVSWPARVERIDGSLDPKTRTVGVIVAVDRPYENVKPGVRPPLMKGVFCAVEIRGTSRPQRVLVPRASISDGEVYVVDAESRLQRRKIVVGFLQGSFACIASGLDAGDKIVVSDPTPAAIVGTLLEPTRDVKTEKRLADAALAKAPR